MRYYSRTFNSGSELTKYLNDCGIQPDHIISITMSTCTAGYADGIHTTILLVYVEY